MKQNGMKADANCNQERIERGLGVVDNAVLCSICSDVYDGAMVLKTCGHTCAYKKMKDWFLCIEPG